MSPKEIADKISSSDHKVFFIEGKELRCDYDEYATNEGIRDCTVNVCQTKDLIDLARAYLELEKQRKIQDIRISTHETCMSQCESEIAKLKSANHEMLSALEKCRPLLCAYDDGVWKEVCDLVDGVLKKAKGL